MRRSCTVPAQQVSLTLSFPSPQQAGGGLDLPLLRGRSQSRDHRLTDSFQICCSESCHTSSGALRLGGRAVPLTKYPVPGGSLENPIDFVSQCSKQERAHLAEACIGRILYKKDGARSKATRDTSVAIRRGAVEIP